MRNLFKASLGALALGMSTLALQPAQAAVVYQSATLGSDDTGGDILQDGRSLAATFSLSQATQITGVGGEFEGGPYGGGSVFAAIVSLADFNSTAPDKLESVAIASTILTIPSTLSNVASPGYYTFGDVMGSLSTTLAAGDYALVFGVGQFGVDSSNVATLGEENDPVNSPNLQTTFFDNTWSPADSYVNVRVFVEGAAATSAVPEPATWAMMLAGFGLVGGVARSRRRGVAVSFA